MVSSEVQRTLVKSPPELWAELSDPASLARHLGELGEIRLTRVEPDRAVDWAGEDISGTVLIKPSGWGTTVTLTAIRVLPEPEVPPSQAAARPPHPAEPSLHPPEPAAQPAEPTVHPAEPAAQPESEPTMQAPFEREGPSGPHEPSGSMDPLDPAEPFEAAEPFDPIAPAEPDTVLQAEPEPAIRRSFFSKLFRRGPREDPVEPEPYEAMEAVGSPERLDEEVVDEEVATGEWTPEPHVMPASEPEPAVAPEATTAAEQADATVVARSEASATNTGHLAERGDNACAEPADIAAELRAAEELAAERVEAVLTAVLDRLGAAHHRPFSRT